MENRRRWRIVRRTHPGVPTDRRRCRIVRRTRCQTWRIVRRTDISYVHVTWRDVTYTRTDGRTARPYITCKNICRTLDMYMYMATVNNLVRDGVKITISLIFTPSPGRCKNKHNSTWWFLHRCIFYRCMIFTPSPGQRQWCKNAPTGKKIWFLHRVV